nr:BglG family transcription antiterminator [Staphylococcus agnetis]
MDVLSNRQQQILTLLLEASQFMTIHTLAKTFHLSERTIQYDIEYIESMAETGGYHIVRHKTMGIKAMKETDASHEWIQTDGQGLHFHFSKDERQTLLKLMLLEHESPMSTKQLAEELNVSRRTILSDIKAVSKWYSHHNLTLMYINNKGYVVEGNEAHYRQAYARLLHAYYDNMNDVMIAQLNATSDLKQIRESVIKVLKREHYPLVQTAIEGLILHLLIAVRRMKQNNPLPEPTTTYVAKKDDVSYAVASAIKLEIESHFNIVFPDSERDVMVLHLLSSKRATLSSTRVNEAYMHQTIEKFVEHIGAEMGVAFFTDGKLIQGLSIHLSPALYRLQNHIYQANPLHDNIIHEYQELYEVIVKNINILEEAYHLQFHAHEISYITLHFASSFERLMTQRHHKLKVVVVCGSGVGTSQLLNVKLSHVYPEFDIIDAYSIYDISEDELSDMNVDLVISTVPTPYQTIETVTISPLLTRGDLDALNAIVNERRAATLVQPEVRGLSLSDVLHTRVFKINQSMSCQQAITESVRPLERDGVVSHDYKQEIMNKLQTLGPYMVISPHIALIHGSTSHVHGVGMSLIHFEKGISFKHPHYDPIYVVICLATENTKLHLKALKQLTELLTDNDVRQQLIDGKLTEFQQYVTQMEGEATWL